MSRRHRRNPQREHFWREAVSAWQKSGLTIRAFCASRALRETSLYFWRRELQKRGPQRPATNPPVLVPLRVVPDALIEVTLPTGAVLRLRPRTSPDGRLPPEMAQLAMSPASCSAFRL